MIEDVEICCQRMKYCLKDERESKSSNIIYIEKIRSYRIYAYMGLSHKRVTVDSIYYCPWCGAKLPAELSDQYYQEIENLNLPLTKVDSIDRRYIPQEYRTDMWWKKRGL